MKKYIIILFLSINCFNITFASETDSIEIAFKVIVPDSVEINQPFQINFVFNAENGKNIKFPNFENLIVLQGPMTSTSLSTSIQGGVVSKTYTASYSFILVAEEENDYTIPEASIFIGEKEYKSEKATIKAVQKITNSSPENKYKKWEEPRRYKQPKKEPEGTFI